MNNKLSKLKIFGIATISVVSIFCVVIALVRNIEDSYQKLAILPYVFFGLSVTVCVIGLIAISKTTNKS